MRSREGLASWLCAAGAVLFAVVTTLVGESEGAPTRFLVIDGIGGLTFVLAGLVAWSIRPEVRTGPLLLGAGALWFVGSYAPTSLMPASLLGFTFERYYDLLLAFLVLTFPDLPLRGARRLVLVVLAGAYLVRSGFRLFVGCACTGTEHPFAVVVDDRLFEGSQLVTSYVIVAAALAVVLLAVHRFMTSGPAAHRYLAPVVAAGVIAALVAAYDAFELVWFIRTDGPVFPLSEPGQETLSWSILAAVVLVPIGLLIGALRRRRGQGAIARMALGLDQGAEPQQLRSALRHALGTRRSSCMSPTATGDGSTARAMWYPYRTRRAAPRPFSRETPGRWP